MDTAITAATLIFGFVGLGILARLLVVVLDQTRKVTAENHATWPGRFYQWGMMCSVLFFGACSVFAAIDNQIVAAFGFIPFIAIAKMALIPALFRRQHWDDDKITIEWSFGMPVEYPWDQITKARATNFPESIRLEMADGRKAVLWTEWHHGLGALAIKLNAKLGENFSVGLMSNLHPFVQMLRVSENHGPPT